MTHRILFVDTATCLGGAEISILALMKNLEADRYVPYLLTSSDGLFPDWTRKAGIPVSTQEFPWFSRRQPWRYALSVYRLVRIMREKRIDLAHTNCDHSLRYVMHASRLVGVPYVSHVRDFVRTWFLADKVEALNQAAGVIANSSALVQACVRAGVAPSRVVAIHNPVDVRSFEEVSAIERTQLRAKLSIDPEALVVGIVASIHPFKGHMEFVQAAVQLANRIPDIVFLIIGAVVPGESNELFLESLRLRILESGHANRFHFTGFRSDIPVVMKAIDILAVPSRTEAFGRAAVEGMASGCAIVSTNAGGLPEIVTDGVDGLLVQVGDVDALSTALYRLAADPDLRQRLAQAGQHTAQRFTIGNHVQEVQALYDAILSVR